MSGGQRDMECRRAIVESLESNLVCILHMARLSMYWLCSSDRGSCSECPNPPRDSHRRAHSQATLQPAGHQPCIPHASWKLRRAYRHSPKPQALARQRPIHDLRVGCHKAVHFFQVRPLAAAVKAVLPKRAREESHRGASRGVLLLQYATNPKHIAWYRISLVFVWGLHGTPCFTN